MRYCIRVVGGGAVIASVLQFVAVCERDMKFNLMKKQQIGAEILF